MKRRIIVLFFIFAALLLASCGGNDESASNVNSASNNDSKKNEEEIPDDIPKDFPFPDSMGNVIVSSAKMQEGAKRYTIAFSHTEEREELYNLMKKYLEGKGCEGEEISGQYICVEDEGDGLFEGTKINIDESIASVTLIVAAKK